MQFPDNNSFIFRRPSDETELRPFEKRLGEGIRSFISELYLVDGGVLLGYICGRQHENLGDIIRSSTELVIKPGRLRYGNDAFLEFDWGRDPRITIAMEFLRRPGERPFPHHLCPRLPSASRSSASATRAASARPRRTSAGSARRSTTRS